MTSPTLVILLLLGLCAQHSSAQLQPVISCWFTSYDSTHRITNYVLGYNNSGPTDIMLPVDDLGSNTLLPLSLNGQQPDLFKVGFYPFVLRVSQFQSWSLGGTVVSADAMAPLSPLTRCDVAFAGACPVLIEGFCEDGSYCNGQESCFSTRIFGALTPGVLGACQPAVHGVQCDRPDHLCSEIQLDCVQPPTVPTEAPTAAPTTEVTTAAPTVAPTTQPQPSRVTPSFYCWYTAPQDPTAKPPRMIKFLVLNYNNTAATGLQVPHGANNTIRPPAFVQQLPTRFMAGYHEHSVIIADTVRWLDVLGMRRTIVWTLTDAQLVIDGDSDLTPARLCVPPTTQPPPSPSPDDTDTGVVVFQCSASAPDCSAFDSFCQGPAVCNTVTQQCIPVDSAFSPCPVTSAEQPLEITCIDHLSFCAAWLSCNYSDQCQDGLFCNGQEYCSNGTCYSQVNFTCGDSDTCVEGQGCVTNPYSISNGAIAAIVIVGSIALLLLCALFCGYFVYTGKMDKKSKSKSKNK